MSSKFSPVTSNNNVSREFMSSHRSVTTGSSSFSGDEKRVRKSQRSKSGDGRVVVIWGNEEPTPEVTEPKQRDYSLEVVREPPPQEEEESEKGLCRYRNILLAILVVAAIVTTIVIVAKPESQSMSSSGIETTSNSNNLDDNKGEGAEPESPLDTSFSLTHSPTLKPTSSPTEWKLTCGCKDCIEEILQRDARGETCEARILKEMNEKGLSEMQACSKIATFYPLECGPHCHPDKCDGKAPPHCSCQECTEQIFEAFASAFTCREYMLLMLGARNITEDEACQITAERFPDVCGVGCNPKTCPSNNVPKEPEMDRCGCPSCDDETWNTPAGDGATCGERIEWLVSDAGGGLNATWACLQIANNEFPEECGACNPMTCHQAAAEPSTRAQPTFCGCPNCVPEELDRDAQGVTCANRIAWLQTPIGQSHNEIDACIKTHADWPAYCDRSCDPNQCHDEAPVCGCASCTDEVLQTMADGFTCAERIYFLMSEEGGGNSERDACRMIAGEGRNYASICGACDPASC